MYKSIQYRESLLDDHEASDHDCSSENCSQCGDDLQYSGGSAQLPTVEQNGPS